MVRLALSTVRILYNNGAVKRKTSTSLASYDIKYLAAWYKSWASKHEDTRRNLVVVLYDFEQLDSFVMQDIFYICR